MKRLALLSLFLVAGCEVIPAGYVSADRATLEASRPVFATYSADHPDRAQNANDLIRSWELRVSAAEGK